MANIIWTLTPTVKEVTLPSGNTYYLKDEDVRNWIGTGSASGAEFRISELEGAVAALSNATHWLGITTTPLEDGDTTNPITINGEQVTAVSGDIVQDDSDNEFIFNGTAWQEFGGSIGTLKSFAFVDTGTVDITPKGTNSSSSVSFTGGTDDSVLGVDTTFTNSASSVTFSGQTNGKLVTTTVPNVTNVGSAASWSASVSNENLTFAWTPDTVPTLGTAIGVATGTIAPDGTGDTVVTAVGSATAAAQTITVGSNDAVTAITGLGTGVAAAQTFTGTEETYTVYPDT